MNYGKVPDPSHIPSDILVQPLGTSRKYISLTIIRQEDILAFWNERSIVYLGVVGDHWRHYERFMSTQHF